MAQRKVTNRPLRPSAAELILASIDCVIDERDGVYVAVPVSTGLRLWELARQHSVHELHEVAALYPAAYARDVLRANMRAASDFIRLVKKRYCNVINPARLNVSGWSQDDYAQLWRRVILKKVRLLILSQSWAYSRGCIDELLVAYRAGIEVRDHEDRVIDMQAAGAQLADAMRLSREYGLRTPFIRGAYRKMESLATKKSLAR